MHDNIIKLDQNIYVICCFYLLSVIKFFFFFYVMHIQM